MVINDLSPDPTVPEPVGSGALGPVTLLHPGAMGGPVGRCLTATGHEVRWVREGRSPQSEARADAAGLYGYNRLESALEGCNTVVSICPPGAAVAVAGSVIAAGFSGQYIDANAVSSATVAQIAALIRRAGGHYIDGAIIGHPPSPTNSTRLYVSGQGSAAIVAAFRGSDLDAVAVAPGRDGADGVASMLKACYAGWTKGSQALLLSIRAAAAASGVESELLAEWQRSQPGLVERSEAVAAGSSPKAWRWVDEMREIARFLEDHGLPRGSFDAAAAIFERLDGLKDQMDPPVNIDTAIAAITDSSRRRFRAIDS